MTTGLNPWTALGKVGEFVGLVTKVAECQLPSPNYPIYSPIITKGRGATRTTPKNLAKPSGQGQSCGTIWGGGGGVERCRRINLYRLPIDYILYLSEPMSKALLLLLLFLAVSSLAQNCASCRPAVPVIKNCFQPKCYRCGIN